MLRFGVAIAGNIALIFLFPALPLEGSIREEAVEKFIAASVSVVSLIVLVPVFRVRDFSYNLAAIILCLLPALIFIVCLVELFDLSSR